MVALSEALKHVAVPGETDSQNADSAQAQQYSIGALIQMCSSKVNQLVVRALVKADATRNLVRTLQHGVLLARTTELNENIAVLLVNTIDLLDVIMMRQEDADAKKTICELGAFTAIVELINIFSACKKKVGLHAQLVQTACADFLCHCCTETADARATAAVRKVVVEAGAVQALKALSAVVKGDPGLKRQVKQALQQVTAVTSHAPDSVGRNHEQCKQSCRDTRPARPARRADLVLAQTSTIEQPATAPVASDNVDQLASSSVAKEQPGDSDVVSDTKCTGMLPLELEESYKIVCDHGSNKATDLDLETCTLACLLEELASSIGDVESCKRAVMAVAGKIFHHTRSLSNDLQAETLKQVAAILQGARHT